MAKKNIKPEVRFAGFTEDWVEKDFSNEVDFFSGLTYSPIDIVKDDGTFVIRSSNIQDGKFVDADNVYVNSSKVNCEFVKKNDIAVVVRNGSRDLIGKHAQIKRNIKNTVVGAFMTGIRSETPNFINALLDSENFKKEINKNLGATINQITTGNFKQMKFWFPVDKIEKEKIGNFFENIDNLITEHQQKHTKLKSLKQAMLDKMFPKHGQLVPEIRFKGFEGEWEEKKLSELSNYSNGKGYESFQSSFGKYELINLNSISIDGGLKPSGKFINHADATLKQNDLVMVLSDVGHGDLLGRVALIPEDDKYVLNQRVALLRPNKEISPYFLYYNINANQLYFKTQGAGMSQLNLSKKSVEDFTSLIPKEIDEQIAIADYLINVDHLIVNHDTQISKLQNIKKAFLAKMFV